MGGWDYHCLLCSAGFHITYQLTNEDEYDIDVQEQKDYPFARLPRANIVESLEWLNNFRLIGQNRRATGIKQCFLSGPAQEEDYGEAKIELGDHPNARSLDHTRLRCYRCGTDESLNHPIHDECLVVLCEAFSHAQNFEYHWTPGSDSTSLPMDLDVLHQCVSGRVDKYHSFLGLRRNLYPDQYFWVDLQQLYYYFSPRNGISLSEFCHGEEQVGHGGRKPQERLRSLPSNECDVFARLPHELTLSILADATAKDLSSLIKASRTIHNISDTDNFWLRRLLHDAPWLYEIKNISEETRRTVDWHRLYNHVMMQTEKPKLLAIEDHAVSGLANRARIWDNAQEIIEWYEQIAPFKEIDERPHSIFVDDVICRLTPQVAFQTGAVFASDIHFFFNNRQDIILKKTARLRWNNDVLSSIEVKTNAGAFLHGVSTSAPGRDDIVEFDEHDWIDQILLNISRADSELDAKSKTLAVTGLTLYKLSGTEVSFGQMDGHKRLLKPASSHGIVGLKTENTDERLTRIGLLEHPQAPSRQSPTVADQIKHTLWNVELPPANLQFKPWSSGYWSHSTVWELTPMEFLIFGRTDRELAEIIAFAGSIENNRFEIHRRDGSIQAIGVRHASMKKYEIDGLGGERILGYELGLGAYPAGCRFITNRGRHLIFGSMQQNSKQPHFARDHGTGFAGIYGSFGNQRSYAFGMIESSDFTSEPPDFVVDLDVNGIPWDHMPPPPSWRVVGPLHGRDTIPDHFAFLDFSRPIVNIHFVAPNVQNRRAYSIEGFAITYAYEVQMSRSACFGAGTPVWPLDPSIDVATLHHESDQDLSSEAKEPVDEDDKERQPSLWRLDGSGEKLSAVTIWADEFLLGIQFHATSGKDSPRWGHCDGEPTAIIQAGGPENIVGLKAVQALGLSHE